MSIISTYGLFGWILLFLSALAVLLIIFFSHRYRGFFEKLMGGDGDNKKKGIRNVLIFMSIVLIITGLIQKQHSMLDLYNIEDNPQSIKEGIENRIKEYHDYKEESIALRGHVDIDNKMFVLFTFTSNNTNLLGVAELTQGANDKFKLSLGGHGNNPIRQGYYKTNKGQYLLIMGKNHKLSIETVEVTIEDKTYHIEDIPQHEYFIKYIEVGRYAQPIHPNIKLFDINKNDITKEIPSTSL